MAETSDNTGPGDASDIGPPEVRKKIQCVQKKRITYFQTAVTSFRIVEIKKVGRDSERARADLSNAYNYFSVTQLGAEIFEFKDDPVPKIFCKK